MHGEPKNARSIWTVYFYIFNSTDNCEKMIKKERKNERLWDIFLKWTDQIRWAFFWLIWHGLFRTFLYLINNISRSKSSWSSWTQTRTSNPKVLNWVKIRLRPTLIFKPICNRKDFLEINYLKLWCTKTEIWHRRK